MSFVPHPTVAEMQQPGFERRYIKLMAGASAEYETRIKRTEQKSTKENDNAPA